MLPLQLLSSTLDVSLFPPRPNISYSKVGSKVSPSEYVYFLSLNKVFRDSLQGKFVGHPLPKKSVVNRTVVVFLE